MADFPMKMSGNWRPPFMSPGVDNYMVVPHPAGLVERGNLPIWNRPIVQNQDGGISSEYSMSSEDEKGNEALYPSVVGGRFLNKTGTLPQSDEEEKLLQQNARRHFEKTGENLGKFSDPYLADEYAQLLHSRGLFRPRQLQSPSPLPMMKMPLKDGR